MTSVKRTDAAVVPSLYIFQFESVARQKEIIAELKHAGWVGEVIRNFKTQGTGRLYVAIVVNNQSEPTHLCRLLRRGGAGLDRISVGLSEISPLELQDAAILKTAVLEGRSKKRKETVLAKFWRLLPEENRNVIAIVEKNAPALAARLREKGQADDRMLRGYKDHEKEIVSLERDSLGLALEIAFDEREGLLVDGLPTALPNSFLDMLGQQRWIEDEVIAFDKGRFPGMEGVEGENPRVKVFKHNGSTLEVIHANRNALEHTLGVDLIYVSHYFNSFIGIQYKMLEGEGRFSPDQKFRGQLAKMESAIKGLELGPPPSAQLGYRLHSGPFFFKFVSRLVTNFASDALCPGLYIPSDLISVILKTPSATIGDPQKTRHLSNSEFAGLFRQGWIGTSENDTAALKLLIQDALEGKRSLTIAIERRETPRGQRRRRPRRVG